MIPFTTFIAAATPSAAITATACAARSRPSPSRFSSIRRIGCSKYCAPRRPRPSSPSGPTPIRMRAQRSVPSSVLILFAPLCPPEEPPGRTLTLPRGKASSSYSTTSNCCVRIDRELSGPARPLTRRSGSSRFPAWPEQLPFLRSQHAFAVSARPLRLVSATPELLPQCGPRRETRRCAASTGTPGQDCPTRQPATRRALLTSSQASAAGCVALALLGDFRLGSCRVRTRNRCIRFEHRRVLP